jgi:hypothetical protein
MRHEVLPAVSIQITVELDMTRSNPVGINQTAQCQIPGERNQYRPVIFEPSFAPDLMFVHTAYTKNGKNKARLTSGFNPGITVI